ncbi:MAG: NADH-quinone oxidoreductase subunit A [Verrucomicrobia bacterium]|jgi:NADH:ubiquinone oxidoreductase subunit 3 (subunit A)|nr:NADH-quinone oxidoreductase subunit A [Verrucomicrobiota bacterium]MDA7510213.1 NADH-quinone oxidoreductase subunit A [Verrucomicrobiota bacterium]
MSDSPYWFLAFFALAAFGFAVIPLCLARAWALKFSPAKPGPDKNATYECGLEAKGDAWIQFKAEYYLYGIIFLVFDVEAIFLLPFAVAFTDLPFGAFLAILMFVFLVVEGLVWAWAKGILNWH